MGTVTFDGVNQTISGTTTFYRLTKQETTDDSTNKTLTFTSGTTTTIGNKLTLDGLDSTDKLLIRASTTSTATINFTLASTFVTTGFLDVEYSTVTDNSSGLTLPLGPANSTNSGNTTGWFNAAPSITAGPSDGGALNSPVNVGTAVTFTATATDSESDNYYLAICKTDAISANDNAVPTCTGGNWAISSSTASASQASVTYTTLSGDSETNVWYAFVCDHAVSSVCSSSSQGLASNGSPFEVNHAPSFSAIANTSGSIAIGSAVVFTSTASDSDTNDTADTVQLFVCKSNDFASGARGAR